MTTSPCGDPLCPVPSPTAALLRRVRGMVLPAGSGWWRGTTHPAGALVPALGNTRFAPLAGTQHAYFGATRTVALLESALHSAAGPDPTIYLAQLTGWWIKGVQLRHDLRVADLRNAELQRLGLGRAQLVDTTAHHYPCTRAWAGALKAHSVGGHSLEGIIWHSRQADLHTRAHPGGLLADVLVNAPTEVGVLWHPPAPSHPFDPTGHDEAVVHGLTASRLLEELALLIGAPIE